MPYSMLLRFLGSRLWTSWTLWERLDAAGCFYLDDGAWVECLCEEVIDSAFSYVPAVSLVRLKLDLNVLAL